MNTLADVRTQQTQQVSRRRLGAKEPRLLPFAEAADPGLVALAQSYLLSLRSLNRAPNTIAKYWDTLRALAGFLVEQGMPQRVDAIRREHLESFLADQVERNSPGTANGRFRDLHAFFSWCVDDDELPAGAHPMARMKAPRVPEEPPPVLREEMLRRLLTACGGKAFEDLRDTAIFCVLYDTGVRRSELAGMRVADIDWTLQTIAVVGKGGYSRAVPFGRKAARALDRYRRARALHRLAQTTDALWLSRRGPFSGDGILSMTKMRARAAGLDAHSMFVHLFRHSFAHAYLADGGQEGDLMQLGGWHSREVMGRYGRSAAADRARDAHRQHSPLDRL